MLEDVDVEPAPLGVVLPGTPPVHLPWSECRRALAGAEPESDDGRLRLSRWLLARRWAADVGPAELADRLRPAGLPVEHLLHPGLDWVHERVLGGALDLGLGAVGLDPDAPDDVVLLPRPVTDAAGLDAELAWTGARGYLEDMGRLAAERLARNPRGHLRPLGDCDVVTLLGSRTLRSALAAASGGLAGAVVPMRRRGWTQLGLVDPAFAPAAAAATAAAERGFDRPLLVTVDEVTVVAAGGAPERIALQQTADGSWARDVRYV